VELIRVFPDYYEKFTCIASKCKHSCCVSWEIDVDPDTHSLYESITGELGEKIRKSISHGENPHFILDKDERCPFLMSDGLCEIIKELGHTALCEICAEHPRFHNILTDRIESGLGLCCEEAARIIITNKERTALITEGRTKAPKPSSPVLIFRDSMISAVQSRKTDVRSRLYSLLEHFGAFLPESSADALADLFLSLEQMDGKWTELLVSLKESSGAIDLDTFDTLMSDRQSEYEQFAVYIIYRHAARAESISEVLSVLSFATLSYELIRALGALIYKKSGQFDTESQIMLMRLFSCEIEYSEENTEYLLNILSLPRTETEKDEK
jgi:lysine-N-methylase